MSHDSGTDLEIVAVLKILSQKSFAERACPIYPGENIIGRASNAAVVIVDKTISKKHACILVEGGEHFVKDCSSKNKTYRRNVELRPEAYYELCNELELTFGEIMCQYVISTPTEAMDVDATVPYAVDDVVSVHSRDTTPDLIATSSKSLPEGGEERSEWRENDAATGASKPTENDDQTLLCSHAMKGGNKDNSLPASPQLLGSPSILSPPTAAESSDSPVEREQSAVPRGRLDDATPFKQTLLLEDETPDTCISAKTPNTTTSVDDSVQDASTIDYSTTGPVTSSKGESSAEQGLKQAEFQETAPSDNSEVMVPTVLYVANEAIEPTVPYPQGEGMVDPTIPYGAETVGDPKKEVEQTIPYDLGDEETDIEDEENGGGVEMVSKSKPEQIVQTVPYHLAEKEELAEKDGVDEEESSKKQLQAVDEVVKTSADFPCPGKHESGPEVGEPPEAVEENTSVPSQPTSPLRTNKVLSPVVAESPDIQLGEDPFEFPQDKETSTPSVMPTKKSRRGRGPGKTSRAPRKTPSAMAVVLASPHVPLSSPASSLNEEPLSTRAKRRKSSKITLSTPSATEDDLDVQTSQELSTPARRGKEVKGKGRARKTATPLTTPSMSASPLVGLRTPVKPTKMEEDSGEKPCVLFTGVTDDEAQKVISSLGGKMAASVYECTHLVTDKMRRTVKFLCCLARGCHIVNFKWVDKCRTQQQFVDASAFVVKDRAFEKQHGFTLTLSRDKALSNPGGLLAGYKFILSPRVKPDHDQLGDIIKCTGGSVVDAVPETLTDKYLVLSAEEDACMFAEEEQKGYPVYSTEFLFAAVLKQELELSLHRLSCGGGKEVRKVASRKRSADTETGSRNKRKPK